MTYFSHTTQNRDQWNVLAHPSMKTLWSMTFTYILLRKLIGKNIYHRSCTFICGRLCSDFPESVMHSKKQWQTSVKCQSMSGETVYNIQLHSILTSSKA